MINCCTKHAMLTQSCWTVCPGEDNESKSRCHKRHSTGKKKKKKKRRRKGEENSSDYDSEFVLKQRDSKCGQSLSPSRRVELPDIIPKQVKKENYTHTHTLFFRILVSLYTESRNLQGAALTTWPHWKLVQCMVAILLGCCCSLARVTKAAIFMWYMMMI